ncbi:MAG: hypothetical protein A4S12_04380 [Proteobacteria bacterium SG_bin5]|nr:hypothetical protein [Sphingomonas sp. SFZ2018-12]MBX9815462.1 hypothetical protein [Sphingomonas sp.]MCH4894066.1 hypothetical protein [Sphingomonas sp. SFZ2018-12]OQW43615.1 MAG: hypothetical protein A4S12_04380 [Proteobacteria bacterium SG_bin5]
MAEVDAYPWVGIFDDLSPEDRLSVAQLVVDGGAVEGDVGQLAGRLKNARMLALLREQATDRIVGVASLKSPDPGYRLNKFDDAGVAITGYEAAPELGYVVVAKDMRGKQLSGRLVELIAKEIREPTFATTDSDTMKSNLFRSGFIRVGQEWKGQKGTLSLWTLTRR